MDSQFGCYLGGINHHSDGAPLQYLPFSLDVKKGTSIRRLTKIINGLAGLVHFQIFSATSFQKRPVAKAWLFRNHWSFVFLGSTSTGMRNLPGCEQVARLRLGSPTPLMGGPSTNQNHHSPTSNTYITFLFLGGVGSCFGGFFQSYTNYWRFFFSLTWMLNTKIQNHLLRTLPCGLIPCPNLELMKRHF